MADTRKDPRAKVLTMTVRYKSATLDEFIEHHSHDVSRGGMFIKTPSPFPPGTLLKFEVKIAEDKKVMQGVGRVVWKREGADTGGDRPAGMGVKFIKIDDESTKVIDTLVKGRGEAAAAYEAGEAEAGLGQPKPAAAAPVVAATAKLAEGGRRKATMMGLGAIVSPSGEVTPITPAAEPEPKPAAEESFFPKTEPEKEMPPAEDRTVMKQAAELLQDALREAGGSMEEVGVAPVKAVEAAPAPTPAPAPAEPEPEPAPAPAEAKKPSERPVAASPGEKAPESGRIERAAEKRPSERPSGRPAAQRVSERPSAKEAASPVVAAAPSPEAQPGGGSGKTIALLLGVAAAAGLVFYLTRGSPPPATPTPPTPTTAPTPIKTAAPTPTPTPTQTATQAPTGEEKPPPAADSGAAPIKSAAPPPVAPKPPPPVVPKPPPPVAPTPPPVAPKPPPKPWKPPPKSDNPY